MWQSRLYLWCPVFLLLANAVLGQGPPGGFNTGSSRGGGTTSSHVVLDTSEIHFFYADKPNVVYPFSDSLLENLHQYDPIRQQALDFAHLGNLGSAHRPLFYQPTFRRGFDVGLHQFDLYQMAPSDIRYYKITQAYSQANYTQGPTQADGQFQIKFSRNFANGLNLTIEHRRINNSGAYDFQKATNSDVAAAIWYHQEKGHYDGFFSFVTNSAQQENNGGTADLELLADTLVPPFQVEVQLETSQTRHSNKTYAYTQYFYLNRILADKKEKKNQPVGPPANLPDSVHSQTRPGPPPSAPPSNSYPPTFKTQQPRDLKRFFTLYHQISWRTESFKFFDTSPDTAFYGGFLTDSRGLRHYLETQRLENIFKLQTFKLREQNGQTDESDLLEVGLVHSLHLIKQEPLARRTQHNLFLTGRLNFSLKEHMRLESYAHLGVGANAGDFRLNGVLFLDFKKIGNLRLEAVNQLYSPSLLYQRFFISQKEFWENDFKKTLETSLSGTYSLPSARFSATGQYHLVSNFIYFDTAGMPRQSGAFSVLQLMARKDFSVGDFHLENWAGLQQTTSDVLPLPQFYSKHSLYFQRKIFKKVMLSKIGLDARLTSGYHAPAYQPLTGQFHLQEKQRLPFTPLLDFFLSFQVKTFRFFFKTENLLTFPTEQYYFQTAYSPLPFGFSNGGVRFGISWRLVD